MPLSREQKKELHTHYEKYKAQIVTRLKEFKSVKENVYFRELCFCILAANTSSRMAQRVMDSVGKIIESGSEEEIRQRLHELHCRFYNRKAEYIYLARHVPLRLDREYLVQNIKGIGYKESSHFLRNIGQSGYAILDKHVLRSLAEFGVIKEVPTMTKKKYLEIEQKMKLFSEAIGIGMDELDLVLWSRKTGEVLK